MITSPAFAGRRYAVLGLARSGAATVEALLASGAEVVAWDADEAKRGAMGQAAALSFGDPLQIDLAGFDGIVVSPGVPLNRHPIAARAAATGVPIIGDIELFAQARASLPPHKVVGITGTNGKSTTTALIHHICETAGLPALMGGNIGLPILGREPLAAGGVYVLELSSFQIDLTFTLDCDVAVLTNITPDHLDRYDGFKAYAASKARLFAMQSDSRTAIVGQDAAEEFDIPGRFEQKAYLIESVAASGQTEWPSLQGPHNFQNARAAILTAQELGIPADKIAKALRTYPGLPHRMERVATKAGVLYVNDSKATNSTATAPALGAYRNIHWILGGLAKTRELDACKPFLKNVVAAYTIGDAGPMLAEILREQGIAVTESGTLDKAVRTAAQVARNDEVVMLSPACASFDQFRDYEARGDAFRAAVKELPDG